MAQCAFLPFLFSIVYFPSIVSPVLWRSHWLITFNVRLLMAISALGSIVRLVIINLHFASSFTLVCLTSNRFQIFRTQELLQRTKDTKNHNNNNRSRQIISGIGELLCVCIVYNTMEIIIKWHNPLQFTMHTNTGHIFQCSFSSIYRFQFILIMLMVFAFGAHV